MSLIDELKWLDDNRIISLTRLAKLWAAESGDHAAVVYEAIHSLLMRDGLMVTHNLERREHAACDPVFLLCTIAARPVQGRIRFCLGEVTSATPLFEKAADRISFASEGDNDEATSEVLFDSDAAAAVADFNRFINEAVFSDFFLCLDDLNRVLQNRRESLPELFLGRVKGDLGEGAVTPLDEQQEIQAIDEVGPPPPWVDYPLAPAMSEDENYRLLRYAPCILAGLLRNPALCVGGRSWKSSAVKKYLEEQHSLCPTDWTHLWPLITPPHLRKGKRSLRSGLKDAIEVFWKSSQEGVWLISKEISWKDELVGDCRYGVNEAKALRALLVPDHFKENGKVPPDKAASLHKELCEIDLSWLDWPCPFERLLAAR